MPSKSKKSATRPTQVAQPTKSVSQTPPATQPRNEEVTTEASTTDPSLSSNFETDLRTGDTTESAGEPVGVPATNRKKAKRRQKEAAKRLAEQQDELVNGHFENSNDINSHTIATRQGRGPVKGYFTEETDYADRDFEDQSIDPDEAFYSNDEDPDFVDEYGDGPERSWLSTSKRKKSGRKRSQQHEFVHSHPVTGASRPALPTLSNAALRSAHKMSNEHIWNTSTQAERENIKQFWLELGEDERRSLVRVEKEAVLRKMKEQQKHSCSCSVCGRKRTAIEEELEVLYDAYYEELEQFANHNNDIPNSTHAMPSPRTYRQLRGPSHPMAGAYPVHGRVRELGEDGQDIDEDDEYEDEEDEDEEEADEDDQYSDEYDDDLTNGPSDFFQFGNSLTVKDGILTVADDLLKNDGKHFIDMMEQLAERRMQREEEIHYPAPPLAHHSLRQGHNHPPLDEDDDFDDEEDEEDYDSQEEDDFEGDEMDSMTEEQRMEEGRRMFQIFAARMFEQRVLTAYKEKVAAERQQKLLEELDEESRLDTQREAKKAKDAAKKKEKKARQKAAKEEEKKAKEAEKAAQEAAVREAEEKRLAEKKAKQEEQRKRRETERKAAEEERLKKEAEKQQRAQKERERQAETERKAREARERDKKVREDARKKEREEREAKEKEAKDRKAKDDKERKERDSQAQKEREVSNKAEKESRDRSKQEQSTRPQPVALPPGLHPPPRNPSLQSPNHQIATPILPTNVSTTGRSRQTSQPSQPSQQSHSSSPRSQKVNTEGSYTSGSPSSMAIPQTPAATQPTKPQRQGPPLQHPQPSAPRSPLNNMGRGSQYQYAANHAPGIGTNGFPTAAPGQFPAMGPPMPMYHGPPIGNNPRFPPNGSHAPLGFNMPRPYQPNQSIGFQNQPPHAVQIPPQPHPTQPQPHSRQASGSDINPHQAPIARPGPIARPSSTTPDKPRAQQKNSDIEVDRIATQLGSKALLDDSDEPFINQLDSRPSLPPVGAPGSSRLPFASNFNHENHSSFSMGAPGGWGNFGGNIPSGNWAGPTAPRPGAGWNPSGFDSIAVQNNVGRSHGTRPITVRLLLVKACRQLSSMAAGKADGFLQVAAVLRQVEQIKPPNEPSVSMDEMLAICDTEGNVQNGGGTFEVLMDPGRGQILKFVEDGSVPRGGVGDIGSPITAPGGQTAFGSIGQGVQQGYGPPGRSF